MDFLIPARVHDVENLFRNPRQRLTNDNREQSADYSACEPAGPAEDLRKGPEIPSEKSSGEPRHSIDDIPTEVSESRGAVGTEFIRSMKSFVNERREICPAIATEVEPWWCELDEWGRYRQNSMTILAEVWKHAQTQQTTEQEIYAVRGAQAVQLSYEQEQRVSHHPR